MFSLSGFVPLDPLQVVLADITTQRFITNADDLARKIMFLTIATAFVFFLAVCLDHLRQNLTQQGLVVTCSPC